MNAYPEKQARVPADIRIIGLDDWKKALDETVKLKSPGWIRICGKEEVHLLDLLQKEAKVNEVTFERCVMSALLERGYCLEELEVEFDGEKRVCWGKSVWYKNHPEYDKPIDSWFKDVAWPNFWHAMFKTEHAGDQHFCLYSTQCGGGILLHKTIIYHKVVFSPPQKKAAEDKVAA